MASIKNFIVSTLLLLFLWINPANSSVVGVAVGSESSTGVIGGPNNVGNQFNSGYIRYFIPLNESDSGVYGVSDTPTCGTSGANTGGAGTCSDAGTGWGYDDADDPSLNALNMFLYFDLSSFAHKDNARLDLWFYDLDLVGINDPDWFLESISVFAENGGGLTDIAGGVNQTGGGPGTDVPAAIADPFTWSLNLSSLGTLQNNFWIRLGFGSDSDYNAWNTAEYLKASVSAIPLPASVWLFGTALLGFIGLSRRTSV